MTNQEAIDQFQSGAIAERGFHHADHVRVGFAYLCQFPALEALQRFTDALKRLAVVRGKPQLYHETITQAYFFLIHERMARGGPTTWEEFAAANADLLIWKGGLLNRYYHEATLSSDLARNVFVLPDRSL